VPPFVLFAPWRRSSYTHLNSYRSTALSPCVEMSQEETPRPKIRLDLDFWPPQPAEPSRYTITFLPARVSHTAEQGMSVFEVARLAGVPIPSECGGKGTCARCRVALPEPVRPATYFEQQFIPKADLARGVRLSCRTRPDRDMIVTVLPDTRPAPRRPH